MNEKNYFPHDYNARGDPEMVRLRREMGWEAIGIYWALIEKSGEEGNFGKLRCEDIEDMAWDFHTEMDKLMKIIAAYSLFVKSKDKKYFWSKRFVKHLKKRQELSELRAKLGKKGGEAKAKQKLKQVLVKAKANHSKVKEIKVKEIKQKIEDGFVSFWEIYPKKDSKQKVIKKFEIVCRDNVDLIPVILEAVKNQIESREADELRGDFVPNWKNPLTWLNGGCWENDTNPVDEFKISPEVRQKMDSYFQNTNRRAPVEKIKEWQKKLDNGEKI